MLIDAFHQSAAWWAENAEAVDIDPYTFSKEAVVLCTMVLAGKGLSRCIQVNGVGPDPVDTPIFSNFFVSLAEGQVSWLNGQHIIVDGGLMASLSSG